MAVVTTRADALRLIDSDSKTASQELSSYLGKFKIAAAEDRTATDMTGNPELAQCAPCYNAHHL
eukprot:2598545-Pyramimonas_sp.AAC.1